MKEDKILEKLRKLMNLKESAHALGNEGEANAAAAAITRLLLEYNLTEQDIPEQEKIDNPIVSEELSYKAERYAGVWYSDLVSVVCEHNMCRDLIISIQCNGRMKRSKFQIVGRKCNVEVVLYLISFLSHQFISIGNLKYPQYKHDSIFKHGIYPKTLTSYMKSFLIGCVVGLNEKLVASKEELSSTTDITALVMSDKVDKDKILKGTKICTARSTTPKIETNIAKEGVMVGRNIEIHKGIHADAVSEELLLEL